MIHPVHLDPAVVISVVYDGPPRAGKTTSVRALARSFGREVYTPEERDGRTIYYDWLEHTGGRFDGAPIRCQIASVPGQRRWTRRRGHFLDRADVVVFVGDTSPDGWPETLERLAELRARLAARIGPPVGLVFQANKRDLADAIPLDEVRARAADSHTAVIESSANDGSGVREAFVFAVRLALDRVRHEHARRGGTFGRPGFGSERGDELCALLRLLDDDEAPAPAPAPSAGVTPPSHDAPSGFVWPPIEGRILLREAAPPAGAAIAVTAAGDTTVGTGDAWIVHSAAGAVFADLDAGRAALIAWARSHAAAQQVLSRRRCIVLTAETDGRWRLWQIVARDRALADVPELAPERARILTTEAAARCAAVQLAVACTTANVGTEHDQPIYIGLVPSPTAGGAR